MRWIGIVAVVCACLGRAEAGEPVTLAVSYFENTAKSAELDPLRKGFADMLITDLAVADDLAIVERARLDQVLGEIELQKNPYFDRKAAMKLGRGLGAAYLLTGSYLAARGTLRIDVRVIDVETGEVVHTVKVSGPVDDLFGLQRQLATELLDGLGAKLTLIQKKKVGAGGTRSWKAFRHWSEALDARDRGDAEAERAALAEALAADPEFRAVKSRLAEVERKVEVLEKSGGRIIRPTTARDFVHNARIQKAEGDYAGALDSLRAAAALQPELVDVWLLIQSLRGGAPFPRAKLKLPRGLDPIVAAYLRGDTKALYKEVGGVGAFRLHAAAFLFDTLEPRLPAKTLHAYRMVNDCVVELRAAESDGRLARSFVDYLPLMTRVRGVAGKYLHEDGVAQIDRAANAVIKDPSGDNWARASWELQLILIEEPAFPIEIAIEPDAGHPHWRERKGPEPGHELYFHKEVPERERKPLLAAARAARTLIYQARPWDRAHKWPGRKVARWGAPIAVPKATFGCATRELFLTGRYCIGELEIFKPSLPPGMYTVHVRYTDADGNKVRATTRVLAPEVSIVDSRDPEWPEIGALRKVHRITAAAKKKYPKLVAELAALVLGGGVSPAVVLGATHYYRFDGEQDELEHVYYDVDWGARGGKALERDWGLRAGAPDAAPDAEWTKYRDAIVKKGHKLAVPAKKALVVPLPELPAGEHTVCFVGVRRDGTRSPVASCDTFELPE